MRKIIFAIGVIGLVAGGYLYATESRPVPALIDGDLIFQTSTSNQSVAIFVATFSRYIHMGIIRHQGQEIVVIEAAKTVREVPLDDWIKRGLFGRFAVYRDETLADDQKETIKTAAASLYGKPYDIFFSFNNDAVYCSELPYLAYKAAGLEIGRVQQLSDLHVDNIIVRRLIRQRWQRHPDCATRQLNFEQCYNRILQQDLITPVSIAESKPFQKIYSNYPF